MTDAPKLVGPSRRQFLAASALSVPVASRANAVKAEPPLIQSVDADLRRYIGFGNKQSGGPGDQACGDWLESELGRAGYAIERQSFSVPWFNTQRAELISGDVRAAIRPQPIVRPTGSDGITGPIIRVDAQGLSSRPLDNAIALVDLPFGRWSSIFWDQVRIPVKAAMAGGAKACVIVTNGPSGKVIALNTDGRQPLYEQPMALLAPNDAAPFYAAAHRGEAASLYVTGKGGRRSAFNLVGKLDRGRGRWLVVSTPRSGWFTCAGERGGGIAAWLHIARWASKALPDCDLAFVCNSGHEYQHLGAEELLQKAAPKPDKTAFWLHLGANLAARDWHDVVGPRKPLRGTDSQRYLVVSPALLPIARTIFAGLAGLESPYRSDELSAGELSNIIAAGYQQVAGIFGNHRFHHVEDDDETCVSAEAVAATTLAFRKLLEQALG